MDTNDIYAGLGETLEKVTESLADRIRAGSELVREKTGEPLYEHLTYRVKSPESMRDKCLRKGLPPTPDSALREIKDAIGLRVVCSFVDDIYAVAELIRNFDGCRVVREKDYVKNAKPNGYRSFHMIIEVDAPYADLDGNVPGRFFAELQLRTIAMDSWAALEHQMSYKKQIAGEELIRAELKRCADELAACDISMQTLRDIIRGA